MKKQPRNTTSGKLPDGRSTRGLRIREQSKDKIIEAYIELVRSGVTLPTVGETARQAKSSVRVIFKHFTNVNALREAAIKRLEAMSKVFFEVPIDSRLPLIKRMEGFIQRQTAMLEAIGPFRRAALVHEASMAMVRASLRRSRNVAVEELVAALGSDIESLAPRQQRELIATLHMICAWPSWDLLRNFHALSQSAARQILIETVTAVLNQFFPIPRAEDR